MDAEVIEIEDDEATQGNSSLKNTNKSKNLEDTAVSGGKHLELKLLFMIFNYTEYVFARTNLGRIGSHR